MAEPPPLSEGALAYVLWVERDYQGCVKAGPTSAIDQDLGIVGNDVDDFALKLAERYGDWVAEWPWDRFTDLNESVSPLWPAALVWQLMSWPFRGKFSYPSPYERLELKHISRVLDHGEWIEP